MEFYGDMLKKIVKIKIKSKPVTEKKLLDSIVYLKIKDCTQIQIKWTETHKNEKWRNLFKT